MCIVCESPLPRTPGQRADFDSPGTIVDGGYISILVGLSPFAKLHPLELHDLIMIKVSADVFCCIFRKQLSFHLGFL